MKHILWLCSLLLLLTTACTPSNTTDETPDVVPQEPLEAPVSETKPEEPPTTNPYQSQLMGDWQSVDDAENWLRFTADTRYEYHKAAQEPTKDAYLLDYNCDGTAPAPTDGEAPAYIRLTEEDMCWYIIKAEEETLELSYVGRGNTLTYKRGTLPEDLTE